MQIEGASQAGGNCLTLDEDCQPVAGNVIPVSEQGTSQAGVLGMVK